MPRDSSTCRRLLEYMTGQIEDEDNKDEVLCSEMWPIVETCVSSLNQLLTETVLDKSPEEVKTEMVTASHLAKIDAIFFSKKPAEVNVYLFTAVESSDEPRAVFRCSPPSNPNHLSWNASCDTHVDMTFIVGLPVCIIQLDEVPGDAGILEVCSYMQHSAWQLTQLRNSVTFVGAASPAHISDMHTVVSEPINGMLSMANASPAPELKMSAAALLQISVPGGWHGPKVRTFIYAMVASEVPQIRFEFPS
ncbi:hypothetical protein F4604DRAFT_1989740 [Suillus subluteus]|nr:hypothetical protein F4604DRAFT_1989740 [Suillus subluteus]